MCIIAIKPKGQKMFDDTTIATMFVNNPDGAGYMYYSADKKAVVINKGFMTCSSLLNSLHSKDFTDTNLILHFRIGTSGLNDKLNCHPFPIYQKNTTKCVCDLAMAHNGILREFTPPYKSDINDTQVFIQNVLSDLKKGFTNDTDKLTLIQKLIGTNKLAFLDDKNKVVLVGNFIHDNGYIYSNNSYQVKTLTSTIYKAPRGITYKSGTTTKKFTLKDDKKDDKKDTCKTSTYKLTHEDIQFWHDNEPDEFWDWWETKHPER